MRILVVGGGGREHAIAWALARSPERPEIFIAPGNAGTRQVGRNVPIGDDDANGLLKLVVEQDIYLTIVGPEKPLVAGLVDRFEESGRRVVGPTAAAARLEGSKAFSKAFMKRYGIPTADHRTFEAEQFEEALQFVEDRGAPIVVKASGLAAGKGAVVCGSIEEARLALETIMRDRLFGRAGDEVVVEAFMEGEEASVFAISDGEDYRLLTPAQDHKRVGEGDRGPNTGGMGAYAPAPLVTGALLDRVRKEIIEPTLNGMAEEGYPYRGFLYCGLMITPEGPKVIEYNCRLGDPEAQVVLPLLETDPLEVFDAIGSRRLGTLEVVHRPGAAACVVLASGGYPGPYDTGFTIDGLETAAREEDVYLFHAGTKQQEDGSVVTAGGRVLGVSAYDTRLKSALDRAYRAAARISFPGMHFRRDIGKKGLAVIEE